VLAFDEAEKCGQFVRLQGAEDGTGLLSVPSSGTPQTGEMAVLFPRESQHTGPAVCQKVTNGNQDDTRNETSPADL